MHVVDRLAGVLLKVQPLDADRLGLAIDVDLDGAFTDDRVVELRDLVALRQVRIKIVLAVEGRAQVDLRLETEPGADRLRDAFLVDDRQHARHRRIDQRDVAVGRAAEFGRGAREQLCLGVDLGVHFEPDDDFPVTGCTCDEVVRSLRHCIRLSCNPCLILPTSIAECRETGNAAPVIVVCTWLPWRTVQRIQCPGQPLGATRTDH